MQTHHNADTLKTLIKHDRYILMKSFKGAWKFLASKCQQTPDGKQALTKLPRYLLLGPPGAGKTTLLANSGLPFVLAKKKSGEELKQIKSTSLCDWWVSKQAIFLDTSGKFCIPPREDGKYPLLWTEFAKLLKRYHDDKPLSGIIIAIDIEQIIKQDDDERHHFLQNLRHRITALTMILKIDIPIFISITKCDKIAGFKEFFADLTTAERNQAWGIQFQPNVNQPDSQQEFSKQFDDFIGQLNQRLIWRLHHERSLANREIIKDFPLQIEKLKPDFEKCFSEFLQRLNLQKYTHTVGLYFTSSLQDASKIAPIYEDISQALTVQTYQSPQSPTQYHAYFSKELLASSIFKQNQLPIKQSHGAIKTKAIRYGVIGLLLSLVMITIVFLSQQYTSAIKHINAAENAVTRYHAYFNQTQTNPNLTTLSQGLNILGSALHAINPQQSWINALLMKDNQKLYKKLQLTYQQALQQLLLPKIRHILVSELRTIKVPVNLYAALKAYLIVNKNPTTLTKADKQFMADWLARYWQLKHSNNMPALKNLQAQLQQLLIDNTTVPEIDSTLVAKTRATLRQIPLAELAYIIVQNQPGNDYINIFKPAFLGKNTIKPETIFHIKSVVLPQIFTRVGYQKLFLQNIAKACNQALQGNAIIGGSLSKFAFSESPQQLAQQVNLLYINDYNQTWNNVVAHLTLKPFTSLAQAIAELSNFTAPNSPALRVLQLIKNNTSLSLNNDHAIPAAMISERFKLLRALLTSHTLKGAAPINKIMSAVNQLKSLLINIASSGNPDEAAFAFAKLRFINPQSNNVITALNTDAKFVPNPLQLWLHTLSSNTWRLIMKHTQQNIALAWMTKVFPAYNKTINDRYPIFSNAQDQISLTDFIAFFGRHGTLTQFVNDYLQPFIDSKAIRWHLKSVDGASLSISQANLSQLQRGYVITNMFFHLVASINTSPLTFKFMLTPIAIEPIVKQITITLNDKVYKFTTRHMQTLEFTWPGNPQVNTVNLKFETIDGKSYSKTLTGPWAWFKLIDKARLLTTNSPQRYNITIDLDGNAAKFLLVTHNLYNPFIPDILSKYRCPAQL